MTFERFEQDHRSVLTCSILLAGSGNAQPLENTPPLLPFLLLTPKYYNSEGGECMGDLPPPFRWQQVGTGSAMGPSNGPDRRSA